VQFLVRVVGGDTSTSSIHRPRRVIYRIPATTETSMIVISMDKGKNWYFIDTNVYKADKLKTILPGISPKLNIPPQKKPKLVPNKSEE
jgi:hypothetical protein